VLKHRAPLVRGPIFRPKNPNIFTMDVCLCGAILNLKAFCFGAIPDNDRVDSLFNIYIYFDRIVDKWG
jgi:hypothetical protein